MKIKCLKCPLCRTEESNEFCRDKYREYYQCLNCSLVFVPSQYYLSAEKEKARYDLHQNSQGDPGYRKFLNRAFLPMHQLLAPNSHGLDFGSGPGPTLSIMFREAGHTMEIYDHYYSNNPEVLEKKYDFITATEVLEHLYDPGTELNRLFNLLKPGGILGIMTKLVRDRTAFATWHYINDLTHVCFFSRATFQWLADQWNASLTFIGSDFILISRILDKTLNQ